MKTVLLVLSTLIILINASQLVDHQFTIPIITSVLFTINPFQSRNEYGVCKNHTNQHRLALFSLEEIFGATVDNIRTLWDVQADGRITTSYPTHTVELRAIRNEEEGTFGLQAVEESLPMELGDENQFMIMCHDIRARGGCIIELIGRHIFFSPKASRLVLSQDLGEPASLTLAPLDWSPNQIFTIEKYSA